MCNLYVHIMYKRQRERSKMALNIDKIRELQTKIQGLRDRQINEEQTKNWIILPLFAALGYDIFGSDEFIPEYTADFGIKKGERVDYAICLNGQPLILIEVKKLDTQLSTEHISQLFRYYSSTDAKIGILTNGDDYWFFTDSVKANQMDQEAYLKFKLSALKDEDITSLESYARDKVEALDISDDVQMQKFRVEVYKFIDRLQSGSLSSDFLDYLSDKAQAPSIDRSKAAMLFNDIYKRLATPPPTPIISTHNILTETTKAMKVAQSHEVINSSTPIESEVPLDTYVRYDKYSWQYRKPSMMKLYDKELEVSSLCDVLVAVLAYIFSTNSKALDIIKVKFRSYIFTEEQDIKYFTPSKLKVMRHIPGTQYSFFVGVNAVQMQGLVSKALKLFNIPSEQLQIKFRS